MSATLVSSNTTIKVNGGGSGSVNNSAATITAAANEYIIVSMTTAVTGANTSYTIGGQTRNFGAANEIYTLYIPPSTSCTFTSTGAGNIIAYNFVRFINTP